MGFLISVFPEVFVLTKNMFLPVFYAPLLEELGIPIQLVCFWVFYQSKSS